MLIPIYLELKIKSLETKTLKNKLENHSVGEVPLYLDLSSTPQEKALKIVHKILAALKSLNLHPVFPYPLYVISPLLNEDCGLQILRSKEDLPSYFKKNHHHLQGKEIGIINKTNIAAKTIGNLSIHENLENLNVFFQSTKKLYDITKELNYYQEVFKRISEIDED